MQDSSDLIWSVDKTEDNYSNESSIEYRDEDIVIYPSSKGRDKIRIKGYSFRITTISSKIIYWCCDKMTRKFFLHTRKIFSSNFPSF